MQPLDARGARAAALDALARRDHAGADLRRKLIDKGYDAAVVEPLLDRLRAENLLDDRRYTQNFVGYHAGRGQGPLRVRAELRRKGIEGPVVDEALDAFPDWMMQLRKTRQKKFGANPPTDYAGKQRQSKFLAYRGFTGTQIRTALGVDIDLDSDTEEI